MAWASSVFRVAANRDRLQEQNWMHVWAQPFLPVPSLSFFFYKTLSHLVHRVVISKGRWVQKGPLPGLQEVRYPVCPMDLLIHCSQRARQEARDYLQQVLKAN